jgi:hypothetical protein
MSPFVNPALLWGLLILAVPILIHLINLVRHRRVQWAAMEFLLASRRKNSAWIKLKELLLLLLRVAAVAAVVLILAQPVLDREWGRLFGETKTHQVVLLDDSFSMSDRWANTSAFDEAKRLVGRLAAQAARQPTPQSFTLLRYSRAASGANTLFDQFEERVDTNYADNLDAILRPMQPSQEAVGVDAALAAVERFLPQTAGEDVVLYVVSDFRARDWEEPEAVAEGLARLSSAAAQIYMVNCVDAARPNLAIASLEVGQGIRAAGVPVPVNVTVRNFGSAPVENVSVLLSEDGRDRPAIAIDQVAGGQSETRTFEVFFTTAGTHRITARLASDPVAADNVRYSLIELPVAVPVLIVDGDPSLTGARFLTTVFQPGGSAHTGLQPQVERPDYLNKHSLEKFQTIYLTDVERLDPPAIAALENYVRSGHGVMFFAGPRTQPKFYNDQLYREGESLFPVPLLRETQLLVDRLERSADIEPLDKGVLSIFAGERNSYLAGVTVERYFSLAKGWKPAADAAVQVLARLRNGAPLVVERKFGEGRVVALLSTAAPQWNNWGRNPSFVVALLELQSYLAGQGGHDQSRLVGTPIKLDLDAARYEPRVRLLAPGLGETSAVTVDAAAAGQGLSATLPQTETSGIYEIQLSTTDNMEESRLFAFNVDADEGDLATVDREHLAATLPNVRYEYRTAADFQVTTHELAGSNLSDWLLYLLVGILIGEQLMAFSASYHPRTREAAR